MGTIALMIRAIVALWGILKVGKDIIQAFIELVRHYQDDKAAYGNSPDALRARIADRMRRADATRPGNGPD